MKRLAFLSALFGVGAAAQYNDKRDKRVMLYPAQLKQNNECPLCGTIAEPYVREKYDAHNGMMVNCKATGNGNLVVCDPPKMVPYGPPDRVTRCKRCNAAFWQDDEVKQ